MIDERFIFIVICVVLSPIADYSRSIAGEIEIFNFNSEHNKVIASDLVTLPRSSKEELSQSDTQVQQPEINLQRDIDLHNYELRLSQNTRQQRQEKRELTTKPEAKATQAKSKLEILNSQATSEDPPQFSRRWSLVGIALTSLISLTILWSLFQTKEQKQDQDADSELVSMETQEDRLEQIEEETELFDEEPIISDETDVVFELIQDLQLSDRALRRKVIWELAQTADSRALEPLVKMIPQVEPLDQNLILDAITQIAFRNIKPINSALFTSLRDANSEVRKNAICDLVILYKPISQITESLNQMLNDSDLEVRQTAAWALKQFNKTSIPPAS